MKKRGENEVKILLAQAGGGKLWVTIRIALALCTHVAN